MQKKCPCCKALNKGLFPQEITAPIQYGKRFDALSYLNAIKAAIGLCK
jgi:phage FluMu protein Com